MPCWRVMRLVSAPRRSYPCLPGHLLRKGIGPAQRFLHDRALCQGRTLQPAAQTSFVEHADPVAEVDEFGDLGGMEQHGTARIREGAQQSVDLLLGADVDAACRVEQQQDTALRDKPFCNDDLLLVPARKGPGGQVMRPLVDLDRGKGPRRCTTLCRLIQKGPAMK